MPQVFGCPNCQNPFQVPDDAGGQAFQCPSCETTVEVPVDVPAQTQAQTPTPTPAEPEIFACPHCDGQFGINASMYGQELACPHCEELVAIGEVPSKSIAPPFINTESENTIETEAAEEPDSQFTDAKLAATDHQDQSEQRSEEEIEDAADEETEEEPAEPVFEPQPVDHLLPPRFDVPDPVRFPSRLGDEVILPDGAGGYQSVDANIVTITHNGEVYHLKRLTPEERQRRRLIHNSIAILVAIALIYLTLRTLGLVS